VILHLEKEPVTNSETLKVDKFYKRDNEMLKSTKMNLSKITRVKKCLRNLIGSTLPSTNGSSM
jgi:hypothetical protein